MFYSEHDIASDRINSQLQQTPKSKSPTTIPTNKDKLNRKQTAGGPAARVRPPSGYHKHNVHPALRWSTNQ